MSSLTHQLDMALMRERLTAMEALLAEHKIKVPKPIKNVESSTMASMRILTTLLLTARRGMRASGLPRKRLSPIVCRPASGHGAGSNARAVARGTG